MSGADLTDASLAEDRANLKTCPWCDSEKQDSWGKAVRGFVSVRCAECRLIYVKNCLSDHGLRKYYQRYLSQVHRLDETLNRQRDEMYRLEYDLVTDHLRGNSVLDVGCSGGYFLDVFKQHGFETTGVEFGEEAAAEAARKHDIWPGALPDLVITHQFDLVIFRGVIEHVSRPKAYLDKAVSILRDDGVLFITSTPNADAFCCGLYEHKWNQHEPEAHIMHFSERHFDEYARHHGLRKLASRHFYEETPYADPAHDIVRVAAAVEQRRRGEDIDTVSPAFWSNMMSVIYRKPAS